MSTNIQIITDALQGLGVIGEGETPSAEQGAYCLRQLNQMLASWAEDDIDLGYVVQDGTGDTCPIPQWAESGVWGKLALRVAAHYGATASPELVSQADDGYNTILRRLVNLRLEGADMSHLPGGVHRWNIETDS